MEGVTFHDPKVADLLSNRYVESRLHMDGGDVINPDLFAEHRKLQNELIGTRAVPHYAIIDPKTGEFLARHRLHGGPGDGWAKDFVQLLSMPPKPAGNLH